MGRRALQSGQNKRNSAIPIFRTFGFGLSSDLPVQRNSRPKNATLPSCNSDRETAEREPVALEETHGQVVFGRHGAIRTMQLVVAAPLDCGAQRRCADAPAAAADRSPNAGRSSRSACRAQTDVHVADNAVASQSSATMMQQRAASAATGRLQVMGSPDGLARQGGRAQNVPKPWIPAAGQTARPGGSRKMHQVGGSGRCRFGRCEADLHGDRI